MRILIADDSDIVRKGIIGLLSTEEKWVVCGEARNGAETMLEASRLRPDLVLLDVNLPDISGLVIARRLRTELPKVKIFIISQHDPKQLLPRAIEAGADECLDKVSLGSELLPKIRALIHSRSPLVESPRPPGTPPWNALQPSEN
jgi:DNA-binding NarL/FixJ family response regulator